MSTYTGDIIRKYRTEKGLTQKRLGELCGIADSAIRRYEAGNANPKIETLQKIADALEIPVTRLSSKILISNEELELELSKYGLENLVPESKEERIVLENCKKLNETGKKEAAKRSSHYTIALEEIEACIADQKTVEDEIEARELARIIEDFLDTLTVENRVIFMRRYWFSDSYKDIAELVGLSEKNISVRLTRIREKMKQYLIEREVFV